MIVLDTTVPLHSYDGTALVRPDGTPYALHEILCNALTSVYKGEDDLNGAEKMARFDLAVRTQASSRGKGAKLTCTPEELVLLRRLLERAYTTLVYAAAMYAMSTQLSGESATPAAAKPQKR